MPEAVQLIRSPGLAATQYAYAAIAPTAAELVFLAGACPLDDNGNVTHRDDFAGQAERCIETMHAALDAAGCVLNDVISTRVLVTSSDRRDLVAAWDVVRSAFGDHDVPSTLLGVTVLGYPGQLVEIEAIAARPALVQE